MASYDRCGKANAKSLMLHEKPQKQFNLCCFKTAFESGGYHLNVQAWSGNTPHCRCFGCLSCWKLQVSDGQSASCFSGLLALHSQCSDRSSYETGLFFEEEQRKSMWHR